MEITWPKLAIVALGAGALAGTLGWGWSSATMSGRLASVRNESMQIGYAQGGRLPSEGQVRAQVELLAAAHRVELADLTVSARDEQGLGRISSLAPRLDATLTGTLRVFSIRATATTHELLWSRTEPIEVELNLRSSVSIRAPSGGSRGGPDVRPAGVSTDVHGGAGLDDYAVER